VPHDAVGEVLRVVSAGTLVVVPVAQVDAHRQRRQSAMRPVGFKDKVRQVLPDPHRVPDAPSRVIGFVPDRVLPEEGVDQPFHVHMLGPVVTPECPAGRIVRTRWLPRIVLPYLLTCILDITHVHTPILVI
jgi:hypothetical protein